MELADNVMFNTPEDRLKIPLCVDPSDEEEEEEEDDEEMDVSMVDQYVNNMYANNVDPL